MLDNLKNWALGQSKRLAAAAALVVTLAASQPVLAMRAACVETDDGCNYTFSCTFYDDNGRAVGSISWSDYYC
jgi:hypothetical protein